MHKKLILHRLELRFSRNFLRKVKKIKYLTHILLEFSSVLKANFIFRLTKNVASSSLFKLIIFCAISLISLDLLNL